MPTDLHSARQRSKGRGTSRWVRRGQERVRCFFLFSAVDDGVYAGAFLLPRYRSRLLGLLSVRVPQRHVRHFIVLLLLR